MEAKELVLQGLATAADNPQDARRATITRRLAAWCLSVVSVGVAALVVLELPGARPTPNGILFCAVILSAWFGGQGPGTLASILATILAIFLSRYKGETASGLSLSELPARALFLGTGLFISWLTGQQRRAEAALRALGRRLEDKVDERTAALRQTNEELQLEISERKHAESLLAAEKRILEMVAKDDPLKDILDCLCRLIEEQAQSALASILLLDDNRLRHGGAPNLPAEYCAAIDGTAIGPEVGSCGTAAYRKEAVFVEDIATDPLWRDYRELALPHGLRACWSTPIFDAQQTVIGTFAMYYRQPGKPQPGHLRLIEAATHIAAIAISGERDRVALRASGAATLASQQLLEQVLATLPVGVATTDKAGNVILTNKAVKRIWGDTIVSGGERWERSEGFWHGTSKRIAAAEWASARALRAGQTSLNELIDIKTFDGQNKTIQNSAAPIRNAEGAIIGSVIVNEDVTERVQTEEALRQTQADLTRMARVTTMGELTASIAHEVNQPLTAIVNNASACMYLLEGLAGNVTEVRAALVEIAQEGERAAKVLDRIRALVKKEPPKFALCDLRVITKDVLGLASHESAVRGVEIATAMPEALPLVRGDQVQLQQVLLNLVINGMEAMEQTEEGRRILNISAQAGQCDGRLGVTLEVRDHGIGLTEGEGNKVFDAFYSTKAKGLGMGLAISRSLIEAHTGRLWARNNDGPGATFGFWLPAMTPNEK